jgi:elongation factor Ts
MITTEMIKTLREKTGAGIMICKKTLHETDGDINKAQEILKEAADALAIKKAERVTSEGLVGVYVSEDKKVGAMIEINCETDFVASNKDFIALTNDMARQIAAKPVKDIESLMRERFIKASDSDSSSSVKGVIAGYVAKFGENINIGRFIRFSTKTGIIQSYVHSGGKIGVLVEIACDNTKAEYYAAAKEVAMQIAATDPLFVSRDNANEQALERERQAYRNQALGEGKPAHIIERIVTGKIDKFYKKNCLLEQPWIKNEDLTIAEVLKKYEESIGSRIEISGFARFERGKA